MGGLALTSSDRGIDGVEVEAEDENVLFRLSVSPPRKRQKRIRKSALLHLRSFDVPLTSSATGSILTSIRLQPDRPYTFGRASGHCDFLLHDSRVSKRHCQLLFDGLHRKVYVLDGSFPFPDAQSTVSQFRRRLHCSNQLGEDCYGIRNSLNGLFLNGDRVGAGVVRELCAGDQVLFVCGNEDVCSFRKRVGFMVQGVVLTEEVVVGVDGVPFGRSRRLVEKTDSMGNSQSSLSSGRRNKRVFAFCQGEIMSPHNASLKSRYGGIARRAKSLLTRCLRILHSDDPMAYIRRLVLPDMEMNSPWCAKNGLSFPQSMNVDGKNLDVEIGGTEVHSGKQHFLKPTSAHESKQIGERKGSIQCLSVGDDQMHEIDGMKSPLQTNTVNATRGVPSPCTVNEDNNSLVQPAIHMETSENQSSPPGKKFFLNRLQLMNHPSSTHHNTVSMPELLHPVSNILRIFIATFTSDILWFLKCCGIPYQLPVTIACHDTERCWSSSPEKRSSMPYPEYPNVELVFPPFPEDIAFGKDLKKKGIGCHHPKLLVLQRDDSLRVIITSANLNANQWNNVTNTIWWQDFPARSAPDASYLFRRMSFRESNQLSSDFAAELARFMASLVIDVPSQAHWIAELTRYNFEGAVGHIVSSIPGIHSYKAQNTSRCNLVSPVVGSLGWAEASVVGLSHLFHARSDVKGIQLKRLAAFLSRTYENSDGMSEVVLRRNMSVVADGNAVSVLVSNPDQASEGDCIQLGFLPKGVAKWVSPLWDGGFFCFSGYVSRKEALAAALGGSSTRVQLSLYVSQGPQFSEMMNLLQFEHVVALSSLIASLQSCTGLWRLEEVLGQYKWPESEQSDFVYGASSIGSSVNAQFISAFSVAAGKKSSHVVDSEESDPEWGCWSASQELRNPSMQILFPTIDRVKTAHDGIASSRRILCFSEKTWQKLQSANILHDAVPHPPERIGHPMHVKVARRRFRSGTREEPSVGWVYCGSHNFSAAAWGRTISNSSSAKLHVCNYELGIIFMFPPSERDDHCKGRLDDVILPFATPAPKYRATDRPATARAMREAAAEEARQVSEEELMEEIEEEEEEVGDEEEENVEVRRDVLEEKEEEKAYAEMLWIQVDSSQSS
ncbi:hypothetical protein LINGRAHAP2_LOCUS29436 [Linum grandiflorum]